MKINFTMKVLFVLMTLLFILSCSRDDDLESLQVNDIEIPGDEDLTTSRRNRQETMSDDSTQLIIDWNKLWVEIDRHTFGMRPNSTARALAYIHLAGYEIAVAEMQGYSSNRNRLGGFNINPNQRQENVDLNIALNTCYALVFDHFMFSVKSNIKDNIAVLQEEKAVELAQDLTTSEIENSIDWGTYVAQRIIAYSQTDSEAESQILDPNPESNVATVGDGLWMAAEGESAWFPYWADVRTFVITPDETSSTPPPFNYSEDTSSDYYAQMDEVNIIVTKAREEDNEDLRIAEFWSDDVEGLMMSPPGRQFSIAVQLIEQADLDYARTLELLLRLGFAMNDAAVSAWADKYTYDTQRPSSYILKHINPDFTTNLARFISSPNPAFPAYPSGHGTFASAAAGVFIDQFGINTIDFTDRSHVGRTEFRGTPRNYSSFSEMAEENGYSRVPLGVHIQSDSDEGLRLGYEIADAINAFNISKNLNN